MQDQLKAICPDCGAERDLQENYCWMCGRIFTKPGQTALQPNRRLAEEPDQQWGTWILSMIGLAILMGLLTYGLICAEQFVAAIFVVLVGIPLCLAFLVMTIIAPSDQVHWWAKLLISIFSLGFGAVLALMGFVAAVLESCKNTRF